MITRSKIKIYWNYQGDIDTFVRVGKIKEKKVIHTQDWYLIESLLQDLIFVKNGNAAEEFESTLNKKLKKCCEDLEVINKLKHLLNQKL